MRADVELGYKDAPLEDGNDDLGFYPAAAGKVVGLPPHVLDHQSFQGLGRPSADAPAVGYAHVLRGLAHVGAQKELAACGIGPGQRVLDVAAGTGNVAIRAAQAGASVVASDLTPESLEVGRREAERAGVTLEWVAADAEALPFPDASFDVVTSSFGVMFAPDHVAPPPSCSASAGRAA